ncbi:SPOUT methyltransferase superfamily protein [Candidatus Kinetoplastibacterium blastocrithidii TCC012E]|uniref:Ribosomal RNA large subunit methyltransferase H n=1 Tax=Candidatus Kinetoplastidibacterium blastocrithidiae TCC012E TaxID=1208922 RepID=M1M000_9PROT|nr:23S rRNA (pseudouridine(1915)-N(3))-methyltransferase RlmH [Candidatus Kinetoplastibacterium blastocrithidii]AFZ83517.1 23S rRNA (pseudouridine1915-N3)-methyltransferase [Candidatus Kinetoplastibacterium blastocrithidii (ex Strigomonas culicis)]AGF49636.1 SPOUT methyltransferase superfamily protein [Candidatus Kinetoplastibacterium blastocrithidii TCC012E]
MMKIIINAIGTNMPSWVKSAWQEYSKRISNQCQIELREFKPETRLKGKINSRIISIETKKLISSIPNYGYISVILDEKGKEITTKELAIFFKDCHLRGSNIAFIIGGPDGLDFSIKKMNDSSTIKISSFTLPHHMVRIILIEQIYRALSILNNHPYHRE